MFKRAIVAAVILVATTITALASPVGTYNVVGTNPGGGNGYRGTVTVTRMGEYTFRVVWTIAGQTVVGTGLWVDEKFSVGYPVSSIAVYTDNGKGGWNGHWANGNATQTGTEVWSH